MKLSSPRIGEPGPFEIEWVKLTTPDHDHRWYMNWNRHVAYCAVAGCLAGEREENEHKKISTPE